MKDQPRKLISANGYWFFSVSDANGAHTTPTGIPSSVPRKQAIAQLKAAKS